RRRTRFTRRRRRFTRRRRRSTRRKTRLGGSKKPSARSNVFALCWPSVRSGGFGEASVAIMRASVRRTGWTVALAGRAPLAPAMLIALVASQMADPSATLGSSLLVASALPPFAGVALSMVDLARTSAARAKLDALLG